MGNFLDVFEKQSLKRGENVKYKTYERCGEKLDGVGPVDDRPSTHKPHRFVQKK